MTYFPQKPVVPGGMLVNSVNAPLLPSPPTPSYTTATTGGSLPEGTYFVGLTYLTAYGETQTADTSGIVFSGGTGANKITVTAPSGAGSGDTAALYYNLYFSEFTPTNTDWYKVNDTPLALGGSSQIISSIDADHAYTVNGPAYGVPQAPGVRGPLWYQAPKPRMFWGSSLGYVVPPPHHAVTMTPHTSGGSIADGTYDLAVTYIYNTIGTNPVQAYGESGLSPTTSVTISGGGGAGSITVNAPPVIGQLGALPYAFQVYWYDASNTQWNLCNITTSAPTPISSSTVVVGGLNQWNFGPGSNLQQDISNEFVAGGFLGTTWQPMTELAGGNQWPHALTSDTAIGTTDTTILTCNTNPGGQCIVLANVTLSCSGGSDIVELWFFSYLDYSTYGQGRWTMTDGQVMTVTLVTNEQVLTLGAPISIHGQTANGFVTALKDTPFAAASIGGGGYATAISISAIANY